MSTNFPVTSIDSFPTHATGDVIEASYDNNEQDAIVALETKIGVDGSAVTTSHDYKLGEVTSSDKAVGKSATQTLTNKTLGTGTAITLGSDAEGDTYYRNSSGVIVRLARGTDNYIYKMNGNVPNWEAETVTNNASTTVAGIVEIATQAEMAAGTSTGGTGAILALPASLAGAAGTANAIVQYDGSGKLPAVSGENLTNQTSYVGAVTSSSQISTTNIDTTFTCNFTAKNITIYYKLSGKDNGTAKYSVGIATWNGTTLTSNFALQNNTATATTTFTYNNTSLNSTSPTAGVVSGSYATVTLSITSITSSGFTVRSAHVTGDASGSTSDYYVVATR